VSCGLSLVSKVAGYGLDAQHAVPATEFFTWCHVGFLQSVKWLAVGWVLSMQFLLQNFLHGVMWVFFSQ